MTHTLKWQLSVAMACGLTVNIYNNLQIVFSGILVIMSDFP